MKGTNAFLLHVSDFILDENVATMSLAGVGAYIKLLGFHQREGSLPADKKLLARMLGVSLFKFSSLESELSPAFREITIEGNARWVSQKLVEQNAEYEAFKAKKRESGKLGGLSKCLADAKANAKQHSTSRVENENSASLGREETPSSTSEVEGAGATPEAEWNFPRMDRRFREFYGWYSKNIRAGGEGRAQQQYYSMVESDADADALLAWAKKAAPIFRERQLDRRLLAHTVIYDKDWRSGVLPDAQIIDARPAPEPVAPAEPQKPTLRALFNQPYGPNDPNWKPLTIDTTECPEWYDPAAFPRDMAKLRAYAANDRWRPIRDHTREAGIPFEMPEATQNVG